MKILALEFSSSKRSVALAQSDASGGIAILATAQEGGRETGPLRMIEDSLNQAHWSRADVECIAVGLGPGSYTGIRIAISIAQGWQLERGLQLLGRRSGERS